MRARIARLITHRKKLGDVQFEAGYQIGQVRLLNAAEAVRTHTAHTDVAEELEAMAADELASLEKLGTA